MKEKKISLGVAICMFIIMLLIITIVGMYFYYNYIKPTKINSVVCLDNTMENQIENVVEKVEAPKEKIISEAEALKIGKEKYDVATDLYLGRFEYDNSDTIENGNYSKIKDSSKIEELFSKEGLTQYLETNEYVKKYNGLYYRKNADRGTDIFYIDNELKIVNIDENKITFNSIEKYKTDINNNNVKEITNSFSIVKEEGKWKVEFYVLPL